MAWLNYSGKNPADFDYTIHGGGGLSSELLKRRRTWQDDLADIVKTVAPQIKSYLQNKKSDEIANQLMNMENPPRAEAVGYDQGAPATSPFTGGSQGMKLQNAYQAYLDKQQEDQRKAAQEEQNSRWKEAQIARLNNPDAPENRSMTEYQREQTRLREMDIQRKQLKGLPPGVPLSVYQNSLGHNFDPMTAFRNAQEQAALPSPDLPPVTQADPTPAVASRADYDALPSGTVYLAPDGTRRKKP